LDEKLNDLLISLNIFSDPKKTNENEASNQNSVTDTNNEANKSNYDNQNKLDDKSINDDANTTITINKDPSRTEDQKNNQKSIINGKTPEQIDTLIKNYQKQIKDYFDKDIAKTNYIERIENELENCKKMINSYSISDSFLRKKFVEMNHNMKAYKEQIDELEVMLHEKENQLVQQKQDTENKLLQQKQDIENQLKQQIQNNENQLKQQKQEAEHQLLQQKKEAEQKLLQQKKEAEYQLIQQRKEAEDLVRTRDETIKILEEKKKQFSEMNKKSENEELLEQEIQLLNEDIQKLENEIQRLMKEVQRLEKEVQRLEKEVQILEQEIRRLENEIQRYQENEKSYINLLEDIELTKNFRPVELNLNKDIIEFYLIHLKSIIDKITQDLKSINNSDCIEEEELNEEFFSIPGNEKSSIPYQQDNNTISYEIYRLNEILKEKEKENCSLKDRIKKLECAPCTPREPDEEMEENLLEHTPKMISPPPDDDIYTIQVNRIRELEKNLHDVTCERDNNMNKISDLEFSLMKAQTLILSNTLNKKEEEKDKRDTKDTMLQGNLNLPLPVGHDNDPNLLTNQNTSFYISELSSFVPPSPPSMSAFSPPSSPTSMVSEDTEPLYLSENIFPNLKKYKSKKNSKSHEKVNHYNTGMYNSFLDSYDNYHNGNNNELFSPSKPNCFYDEDESKYKNQMRKLKGQSSRNTLYVCDGLDNIYNGIEDNESRQHIAEQLSSIRMDAPKKRDFDKEHRRANSIDCLNIKSNKYNNRPPMDMFTKSNSFATYENAKEPKKENELLLNKSCYATTNSPLKLLDTDSRFSNDSEDLIMSNYHKKDENEIEDEIKEKKKEKEKINNEFDSIHDIRDTYMKVPQMVVEYDRSRITIKSEEIEKFLPLNYILKDKNTNHHSITKNNSASVTSSSTCDNPSFVSSSSKSLYNTVSNRSMQSSKTSKSHNHSHNRSHNHNHSRSHSRGRIHSHNHSHKHKHSHSKTRKLNKSHQQDLSENYINQTTSTIKNGSYQSKSMIIDKGNLKKINSKSSLSQQEMSKSMTYSKKESENPTVIHNTTTTNPNANAAASNNSQILNQSLNFYNNYGNYINYNSYSNYNLSFNDDDYNNSTSTIKNNNKITDLNKIPRNKTKSNSRITPSSTTKNELTYHSMNKTPTPTHTATPTNNNHHHSTILSASHKYPQNSLKHENSNTILNKEVLNELKAMNNSQNLTVSPCNNEDEEEENTTSSDETASTSDDDTTCSTDTENESNSGGVDTDNDKEEDNQDYPSYIIKQNDTSKKFIYNEPYHMNQNDHSELPESKDQANSGNHRVKKHSHKINYGNPNYEGNNNESKSRVYTHSHHISDNNKNGESTNKSNINYSSYRESPSNKTYSTINPNHPSNPYETSILKNFNSNSVSNNNNSIYNYNLSYSQQHQSSYNPLSSLTYVNTNNTINYSTSNHPEKKRKEVIKKRKIPKEKKKDELNLDKIPLSEQSNTTQRNNKYNDKSFYPVNNNIFHSALNNMGGNHNHGSPINNIDNFINNKENYNNTNFNQPKKETLENKNNSKKSGGKIKDKEEMNNIYKLSHRISKIFSSKKNHNSNSNNNNSNNDNNNNKNNINTNTNTNANNGNNSNSAKRISQISIDDLLNEKNNRISNFFNPNFHQNKRNSIAVIDTSRLNCFADESENEKNFQNSSKKTHTYMKNWIPKM